MTSESPLRIAMVAGEESGDLLGVDLAESLRKITGRPVELSGVGGRHLREAGMDPLFDGSEIALMGITTVVKELPKLMRRINQTAAHIVASKPDCLITIDSPDFALRVAKKVREADPKIPIIHYVCPSVWAWRPGRAPSMKPYIDEILCVLPFEPEALRTLDGPQGTYVGHCLAANPGVAQAAQMQTERIREGRRTLLVLPGSRRSEVRRLLRPFGETVGILAKRGHDFEVVVPTVPHVAQIVRDGCLEWPVWPRFVESAEEKWQAFGEADAALAASGTVLLELALSRVPMISCYRPDWMASQLMRFVTTWSAALPNLIADWPVVPEFYNDFVRPEYLARLIEQLWADTPARIAQIDGLLHVARRMKMPKPPGDLAAEVVLRRIGR
ncbi:MULTISPECIES: lipid-A-disaccharide synthase [unclassified Aminobacter]|uniref:lipid-A-disaccharide synthase n=1 Tax=unclassified Aminobacter TaxID=2644704 RepID=UPI0004636807|nr:MULTISPECIES: lipid-A-disaccharide synthase [unclassified Aminobacter]TWH33517.1 lipid-A-disaccharide synthase [Aminobacter sp. J15]